MRVKFETFNLSLKLMGCLAATCIGMTPLAVGAQDITPCASSGWSSGAMVDQTVQFQAGAIVGRPCLIGFHAGMGPRFGQMVIIRTEIVQSPRNASLIVRRSGVVVNARQAGREPLIIRTHMEDAGRPFAMTFAISLLTRNQTAAGR